MASKKFLIFDTSAFGHHSEYIHHLYEMARNDAGNHYVFFVPKTIEENGDNFTWAASKNISFDYIRHPYKKGQNRWKEVWLNTKELLYAYRKHRPDEIFMITLVECLPLMLLAFVGKRVKISGIIYRIYFYNWSKYSWKQKLAKGIINYWLCKSPKIKNIFVLNDEVGARHLNHIWKTNKYVFLSDPYVGIQDTGDRSIVEQFPYSQIIIQIGIQTGRHGTLESLESIKRLPQEFRDHYVFVFAGHVSGDIRARFYELYENLKAEGAAIIVMDSFLPYETLADLCEQCDYVLMPYTVTDLSSGILNYAAQFEKIVIAPTSGLLGRIVKRYHLGITFNNSIATELYNILKSDKIDSSPNKQGCREYVARNTVKNFQDTIEDVLCSNNL